MTRRLMGDLPPDTRIPLTMAHTVVGKARSTLYAWVARGILVPENTPDGMMVTPAQVRAAEAKIQQGRPRVIPKSGQHEIGSPVD